MLLLPSPPLFLSTSLLPLARLLPLLHLSLPFPHSSPPLLPPFSVCPPPPITLLSLLPPSHHLSSSSSSPSSCSLVHSFLLPLSIFCLPSLPSSISCSPKLRLPRSGPSSLVLPLVLSVFYCSPSLCHGSPQSPSRLAIVYRHTLRIWTSPPYLAF